MSKLMIVILAAICAGAEKYNVPPDILYGIVSSESDFRDIEGTYGDTGPAQVNKRWWSDIGYNLQNPYENVMAAAHILDKYRDRCGNIDCAIKAYNVGITEIMQNRNKGQKYLDKVRKRALNWKRKCNSGLQ